MNKLFFSSLLAVMLLGAVQQLHAQFQVQGSFSAALPISDLSATDQTNAKSGYAKVGYGATASARYLLAAQHLALGIQTSFHYFIQDKDKIPTGGLPGLGVRADNNAASFTEYSALVEYYILTEKVRPYVGINVGYGTTTYTTYNTNSGTATSFSYNSGGLMGSPVLGAKFAINDNLDFDINLRYYFTSYKSINGGTLSNPTYDRSVYSFIPLSLGLAYKFGE